jgi:hypothetical protein
MPEVFPNFTAVGTVGTTQTAGATTLVLGAGQGALFPSSGTYTIYVEGEMETVTGARSTDTLTGIVRGEGGTTAASHAVGAAVEAVLSARGVETLRSPVYDVTDYGLVGNKAAWDAMIAVVPTGSAIYFPAGVYRTSGELTTGAKSLHIYGDSRYASEIKTTSATAAIFSLNFYACLVERLKFTTTVTRTAPNPYVHMTSSSNNSVLREFWMDGHAVGVRVSLSGGHVQLGYFANGATGAGTGGILADGINEIYIDHCEIFSSVGGGAEYAIKVTGPGSIEITDCGFVGHTRSLWVENAASVYCNGVFFDNAGTGIYLAPGNGQTAVRSRFVGCWATSATGNGVEISPTGTGVVTGVEFLGHHAYFNGGHGFDINGGASTTGVKITGSQIGANTGNGVDVAANVGKFQLVGNAIGTGSGHAANANGVVIAAGASDQYVIVGNDLSGNTGAALTDGGTGTNKRIEGNLPHTVNVVAVPAPNALINGGFNVNQVVPGAGSAGLDDVYFHDGWNFLVENHGDAQVLNWTTDIPAGATHSAIIQNLVADRKSGYVQFMTAQRSAPLLKNATGRVSLQFKGRQGTGFGTSITTLKAAVLVWSGTADVLTSDVVSTWGATGVTPTLVASWTMENTPAALTINNSAFTLFEIEDIPLDTASGKNVAVFIWTDDRVITATDCWVIADVKLEAGPVCTAYVGKSREEELPDCYYHVAKTFPYAVAPAQNAGEAGALKYYPDANGNLAFSWEFPRPMFAAPTITTYNPSAANNQASNTADNTDTPVAVQGSGPNERSVYFEGSPTDATDAQNWMTLHALAIARL